jgi:trigger factor
VVRWYYSDNKRMAEVEAIVIENNVTDYVLAQATITPKVVDFDELMGQS